MRTVTLIPTVRSLHFFQSSIIEKALGSILLNQIRRYISIGRQFSRYEKASRATIAFKETVT